MWMRSSAQTSPRCCPSEATLGTPGWRRPCDGGGRAMAAAVRWRRRLRRWGGGGRAMALAAAPTALAAARRRLSLREWRRLRGPPVAC